MRARGRSTKWHQTQEQRLLDIVQRSVKERQETEPEFTMSKFHCPPVIKTGPSMLSPNPCRLLMSSFVPKGSAISPHEMTGKRLQSILLEKLKSKSPHTYRCRRQASGTPQRVKVVTRTPILSSASFTRLTLKRAAKRMQTPSSAPLTDLHNIIVHDTAIPEEQSDLQETVEDVATQRIVDNYEIKRQIQAESAISYALKTAMSMKSNICNDQIALDAVGKLLTGTTRAQLLTHMSKEDIEQEALRNRLLITVGLKKPPKQEPYKRAYEQRSAGNNNNHAPPGRINSRMAQSTVQPPTQSRQAEQHKLQLTMPCISHPERDNVKLNLHSSTKMTVTNSSTSTGRTRSEADCHKQPCPLHKHMCNYLSKQTQLDLSATYRHASVLLKLELSAKQRKKEELLSRLRHLQVRAANKLQPNEFPPSTYCYLNIPCCHVSLHMEPQPAAEDRGLCPRCRCRIEKHVLINTSD